jgi:adenylate cyclase
VEDRVGESMERAMESTGRSPAETGQALEIRFFGPLAVRRKGVTLTLPASRKARALLAYLALSPHPAPRSQLCDLLWDAPNDPRGELRWCLSKIRSLVDDPGRRRVQAQGETLTLDLADCFVDAAAVVRASQEGFETFTPVRLKALADLIAGDFLAGLEIDRNPAFEGWLVAQRRRFRDLHASLLEYLTRRLPDDEARIYLDCWLQLAPFDLLPHKALLTALAAQNRIREGEEHLAATARQFDAEGVDFAPLRAAWHSARGRSAATPASRAIGAEDKAAPAILLSLPVKPSIAVLPFTNMSNDRQDESFADGLTEDLITDLSRNAGLFVIARNSVFVYKGQSVDVRQVSQELGVRYVLEGSARRASGRVRINAQLIDAVAGKHVWAERFDRTLEDIFAVQDEVNGRIVEALIGRLTVPAPRKRPQNLEAHDLCVRARVLTEESPQTAREAYLLLKRAIELEPSFAEAHGLLAYNRWLGWTHFGEPEDPNRIMAVKLAERAVALDPNDAGCHYFLGTILAYDRRWQESDAAFARALEIDPNHADTWAALSDMSVLDGRIADSLEQIQKALRLNPYPACWYFCHLGQAQYAAGDYESAVETLRREETYRTNSRKFLAASLAQLGRVDEAGREREMFLVAHPHFTIGHWTNSQPLRDAAVREHFVDGFRKARLPE